MAEPYLRQGALAHLHLAVRASADPGGAGLWLSDPGFRGQLALRGSGDAFSSAVEAVLGVAPPGEPNRAAERRDSCVLWLGPDEWLVVLPERKAGRVWKQLLEALRGQHAAVADVGEARAVIGLAGPKAREALSHGSSLDLHPRAFRAGHCAQTLLARMPVILHQQNDTPAYELYVQRSLAEHLWHWLEDAGRDYGVAVLEA